MEFHRSHPQGRDLGRVLQEERQSCKSELPSERPYGGLLVLLSTDGIYIYRPWWHEWGRGPRKSAPMRNSRLCQVSLEEVRNLRRGLA